MPRGEDSPCGADRHHGRPQVAPTGAAVNGSRARCRIFLLQRARFIYGVWMGQEISRSPATAWRRLPARRSPGGGPFGFHVLGRNEFALRRGFASQNARTPHWRRGRWPTRTPPGEDPPAVRFIYGVWMGQEISKCPATAWRRPPSGSRRCWRPPGCRPSCHTSRRRRRRPCRCPP